MPTLPAPSSWTDSGISKETCRQANIQLRAYLATLLGEGGTQTAALAALGALLTSVAAKSSAYTVVDTDRGRLIDCTGTFTLSLTACATLGAGFSFAVTNSGTGTLTLDPSGAELIDGASTLALAGGESALLFCTGSTWRRLGGSGSGTQGYAVLTAASGSFTVPAGVRYLHVSAYGGGGGGGGGFQTGEGWQGGGTGGHGGAAEAIIAVTPGQIISYTLGAGGAGGTAAGSGTSGGATAFGGYLTAGGGGGGGNYITPGATGVSTYTGIEFTRSNGGLSGNGGVAEYVGYPSGGGGGGGASGGGGAGASSGSTYSGAGGTGAYLKFPNGAAGGTLGAGGGAGGGANGGAGGAYYVGYGGGGGGGGGGIFITWGF